MPLTQVATETTSPISVVGYQKWRDLLFLHWPVPAEDIQAMLPARLTVDTLDGMAWVGLVAFDMFDVRPWWFPALPGVSNFHETNLRTYVRLNGDDPAVWFFSLDAANSLAVRVARWLWHLNYYRSTMSIERGEDHIAYTGKRRWPPPTPADYEITVDITGEPSIAEPASFEHFLVERYILYTQRKDGMLLRAAVRHEPYPLRAVVDATCRESLTTAAGITVEGPPSHAVFSPGVDVEIGRLEPV